jgi:predicted acyl esterase
LSRRVIVLVVAAVVALAAAGRASASKQELTLRMDDGVDLAATLYEPNGPAPPAGYPAIVLMHGLGETRQRYELVAQGFTDPFAVLSFDFRGHGQSGGVCSVDGPRDIADVKAIFEWLRARPEIDDAQLGAWGISLGGGAVLKSLTEGVPWKAAATLQTWTDLYSALLPQNLSKSGAVFNFLNLLPTDRWDSSVLALRDDALASRNLAAIRAWADARSTRKQLSKVSAPVFMFQGRRDFAFDLAQAKAGYRLLKGPKRLYMGAFGHAPSTFPGPDIGQVISLGRKWFSRYLLNVPMTVAPYSLAPSPWRGKAQGYSKLPPSRVLRVTMPGTDRLAGAGRALRLTGPLTGKVETFGAPVVRVDATLSGGWSRIVAVLTAQRPRGGELVISEGGVNTTGLSGKRRLTIRLLDTATLIPRGSRLRLYLASNSTAQNAANLLYLSLPMPSRARVRLGPARLSLPILRKPVSR